MEKKRATAWAVHAFTLSGLIFASLATLAIIENSPKMMWLWLGIAMAVDAVDGTFARRARVKEIIPWFNGGIVDIAVDYLTWTFLPAVFMYLFLPLGPKPLAMVIMILVLVSSMFCYANENWKSTDFYFVGFPAAWNIVAVILWIVQTGAVFNVLVTVILAVLTLVPTYYTHPFRVKKMMAVNIATITLWILSTAVLVAVYPKGNTGAWFVFWITGAWFMITGIIRTVNGKADTEAGSGAKRH